jgi:integrase
MYSMKSFLESLVSDATRRSYKRGLAKFEEYYGKSPKFLLKEKDPGKTIEKFYVWLRKKYSQNSCRTLVNPIIQYCKYNNIEPRIKKSLHIYKTTVTTRDHMLTVDEARSMYEIGSLEEKVIIKTWLLGLRIGDAVRLEWKQFDLEPSEDMAEVLIHTKKEDVVAHAFIDPEFQELLAKYIPNLDQSNPYVFQSERGKHLSEKQMLRKKSTEESSDKSSWIFQLAYC